MSRLAGVDSLDALGMLALSDDDLLDEVASLPGRTLALHDDSELSLAGLEDKILLVRTPDGWARPVHGYPSTHILKVDNRVHRGTVVMEHDCLQLARRAGIPASDSRLTKVGDADCIVVERYDRLVADGVVRRVHPEDSCQALGLDPGARPEGRGTYESHGGPSLAQGARLLGAYGAEPDAELVRLLERVTFTVVIGDSDAHGKNVPLLHPAPEHITLAPLYDTVPTAMWPRLRPTAAMHVNGCTLLAEVTAEDLVREARAWGLGSRPARSAVAYVCGRLRAAAAALPDRDGLDPARLVTANLDRLGG